MRSWARMAGSGAAVAVVVAVLGAPLGWLWAALAPTVPVQVVPRGVSPTEEQPEEFFAGDGWFVLLGVAFGLLVAVAVWFLLRRRRGPAVLVAMTIGAVGAGVLAWWVGHRIGLSDYRRQVRQAAIGTPLDRPPELAAKELGWWFGFIPRVQGVPLMPAIAAAAAYTMLAAWSRYPSLGREQAAGSLAEAQAGSPAEAQAGLPAEAQAGLPAEAQVGSLAEAEVGSLAEGQAGPAPDGGARPLPDGPTGPDQGVAEPQRPAAPGGQLEVGGTASSDSGTGTART